MANLSRERPEKLDLPCRIAPQTRNNGSTMDRSGFFPRGRSNRPGKAGSFRVQTRPAIHRPACGLSGRDLDRLELDRLGNRRRSLLAENVCSYWFLPPLLFASHLPNVPVYPVSPRSVGKYFDPAWPALVGVSSSPSSQTFRRRSGCPFPGATRLSLGAHRLDDEQPELPDRLSADT